MLHNSSVGRSWEQPGQLSAGSSGGDACEHPSAPQLCLLVVLGETEPPSQFWGCTAMPGAEEQGGAMLTSPCCL